MIDAHCHLTMYPKDQRLSLLDELAEAGFEALMMAGYDPADWETQKILARQVHGPILLPVFGLHPWHARTLTDATFELQIAQLALQLPDAVACGELGLDYYIDSTSFGRKQQIERCERLLDLACQQQMPLVIHCVRAHHDMIRVLKNRQTELVGGMVHSFVGHQQIARSYWDLGFCISISPFTLRSPRPTLYRAAPADLLLIETDAPQNIDPTKDWTFDNMTKPSQILQVAEHVAHCRSITTEELFSINRQNILKHFPKTASLLSAQKS